MSEGRRHGGAAEELVQVETDSKGGQALHVGAVDELLAANYVRLEGKKKKTISKHEDDIILNLLFRLFSGRLD